MYAFDSGTCGPIDFDFQSDNKAMFIAPMKNAASDYNTAFHSNDLRMWVSVCESRLFAKNGKTIHKTVPGEKPEDPHSHTDIFSLENGME